MPPSDPCFGLLEHVFAYRCKGRRPRLEKCQFIDIFGLRSDTVSRQRPRASIPGRRYARPLCHDFNVCMPGCLSVCLLYVVLTYIACVMFAVLLRERPKILLNLKACQCLRYVIPPHARTVAWHTMYVTGTQPMLCLLMRNFYLLVM
jgi:hypothetical protein